MRLGDVSLEGGRIKGKGVGRVPQMQHCCSGGIWSTVPSEQEEGSTTVAVSGEHSGAPAGSHLEMAAPEGKPSPGGHVGGAGRELPPLSQPGSLLSVCVLGILAWVGVGCVVLPLPTIGPTCPSSLTL